MLWKSIHTSDGNALSYCSLRIVRLRRILDAVVPDSVGKERKATADISFTRMHSNQDEWLRKAALPSAPLHRNTVQS